MQMLMKDLEPFLLSEDEWHASGEESFLVKLDKPELMAESIYNEAMKIMSPIHDQLETAREFLDGLDDADDDETNNLSETKE